MNDPGPDTRRAVATSALSLAGPVCVAIIPVVTALIVWLGPEPTIPTGPSRLAPALVQQSLSEPRDKVALAMWFLVAVVLALALSSGAVEWLRTRAWAHRERWVWAVMPGMFLIAAGLLYRNDVYRVTPRVGPIEVVVGLVLAAAIVWIAASAIRPRKVTNALMIIGALALYAPVWLQLPTRLPDWYHARFTLSEIAAVGAGSTPLHDFFPQYTQLLGFPIAPLLRAFPSQASTICLAWVLLLQAVALVVAVWIAAWSGGRRFLGPAAFIVPSLAFAASTQQWSSFTYFGVNPLRTVLPVLTIAVACVVLRDPSRSRRSLAGRLVLIGAMAGMAALNNPDYGLPVLVIVWVCAAATAAPRRRLMAGGLVPIAAAAVFFAYTAVAAAAGVTPYWTNWLLFPSIFGSEGFFNIAMAAIGWHVAGVTLFVTATVAGAILLRSSPTGSPSARRRQGLALLLVGGWSLLTLPYYAGRSVTPTFLGGYSLQIGWTVACLLPLIVASMRRRPWRRSDGLIAVRLSAVLGVTAITACMSMLTQTASTDAFNRDVSSDVVAPPLPSLRAALAHAPDRVAAALRRGEVAQAVGTPTLLGLEGGIRSVAAFSSTDYFAMSPSLVFRQCERLADDPARFVVIQSLSKPFFDGVPECSVALNLSGAIPLVDPLGLVPAGFQVIPRR